MISFIPFRCNKNKNRPSSLQWSTIQDIHHYNFPLPLSPFRLSDSVYSSNESASPLNESSSSSSLSSFASLCDNGLPQLSDPKGVEKEAWIYLHQNQSFAGCFSCHHCQWLDPTELENDARGTCSQLTLHLPYSQPTVRHVPKLRASKADVINYTCKITCFVTPETRHVMGNNYTCRLLLSNQHAWIFYTPPL